MTVQAKPDLWSLERQTGMNKHFGQHHETIVITTQHQITTSV